MLIYLQISSNSPKSVHKFTEFETIGNTLLIGMWRDKFRNFRQFLSNRLCEVKIFRQIWNCGHCATLILRAGHTQSKIRAVDLNNDSQNLFDIVPFFYLFTQSAFVLQSNPFRFIDTQFYFIN